MDDLFIREVDEAHRREQIAELWRRYSGVAVGLALLLVGGVGGYRYWEYSEARRSEVAATRFADALDLDRTGKADEFVKALEALASDSPAGYRSLSLFRAASEEGLRDPEGGAKRFDALATDAKLGSELQDLAKLRAASLRLDTDPAAASRTLDSLATPTSPWRHTARELLGLAAFKRGDLEGAGRWFDQIAADRETPQGLRSRLEIYTALVAGGAVQPTQ